MRNYFRSLAVILVFLFIVPGISGCGGGSSKSSDSDGPLVSSEKTASIDDFEMERLLSEGVMEFSGFSHKLGGVDLSYDKSSSIIKLLKEFFQAYSQFDIKTYKIVYEGAGYQNLSGLLVVPHDIHNQEQSFPLMAYQHPTQVLRSMSPSNFPDIIADDQLTIPMALFMGRAGYIVAVADYPGLGDNYDIHPYCLKTLGPIVSNMLEASLQKLERKDRSQAWNGQTYLMGFSEGGYATVVTAQELQENHAARHNLRRVAALDGPHSLSQTMRDVMLNADSNYQAPYFLPYVIDAFGEAYGDEIDILKFENAIINPEVINPDTLELEQFNPNLRKKLTGEYGGDKISEYIRLVSPYEGPASILVPEFLSALGDDNSAVVRKLRINDSTYGWSPLESTTVKFFHNDYDDLVPKGNSEQAMNDWQGLDNVSYKTFTEALPFLGSIHAGALAPAIFYGFQWIDKDAWPDRGVDHDALFEGLDFTGAES